MKKISLFYKVVIALSFLLVVLLSYIFIMENGLKDYLLLILVATPIVILLIYAAIATQPNQLNNPQYRKTKQGQKEWKKRMDDFLNK